MYYVILLYIVYVCDAVGTRVLVVDGTKNTHKHTLYASYECERCALQLVLHQTHTMLSNHSLRLPPIAL